MSFSLYLLSRKTLNLGSVRTLTDANAQVANSYDYDSFGRRLSAVEAVPQPYGWKAREFLPGPDIYYNRARFYDPVLGRFISEDPLGYEGGDTNLYAFTWNNPRNWSDPSGLSAAGEYGGMAGATTSALARGTVIRGTISSAQQAAALQRIRNLATLSRIAVRIACNLFIASSAVANEGGTVDQENCSVAAVAPKAKPMPPSWDPGDCDDKTKRGLQDDINRFCKKDITCKGLTSRSEVEENISKFAQCLNARYRLNGACFRGKGHRGIDQQDDEAIKSAHGGLQICHNTLKRLLP